MLDGRRVSPAEADQLVRAAERGAVRDPLDVAARLDYTRAEVAAARKRWAQAEEFAARAAAHPGASAYTKGRSYLILARIAASRHGTARAIRDFLNEAVDALKDEPPRVRAKAPEVYADLLAARSDWKDAYEQAHLALDLSRPKLSS